MLRTHTTVLHHNQQQHRAGSKRSSSLVQVAAFTAARLSLHSRQRRSVAVSVAPPDGGMCAAAAPAVEVQPAPVPAAAELEQQRSFLESLPTLPQPGSPAFEFSSEDFLQRFEMSEVLGQVSFG
jgi:hypothetical protein